MSTAKITISMPHEILRRLDRLVQERVFLSRSRAIQGAVHEKLERLEGGLLPPQLGQSSICTSLADSATIHT